MSYGKSWTEAEVQKMIDLHYEGLTHVAISAHLPGRTANAIGCKLSEVKELPGMQSSKKRKLARIALGFKESA